MVKAGIPSRRQSAGVPAPQRSWTGGWATLTALGLCLLASSTLATEALSQALDGFLGAGQPLEVFLPELLAAGHNPQQVAEAVLQARPWEATQLAVLLAREDPTAAPLIASAVAAIAVTDPAPVAAAVAREIPSLAPEIAAAAGLSLPQRAPAVLTAVLEVVPAATPEIVATSAVALPEQTAAFTRLALAQPLVVEQLALQTALIRLLGQRLPEHSWQVATALLSTGDNLLQRVERLQLLLRSAGDALPPLADAPLVLAAKGLADELSPGSQLPSHRTLDLNNADNAVTLLSNHMVCHCAGPTQLQWEAPPLLERGWCRCIGSPVHLAWSGGVLQSPAADILLAVGPHGAGLVVLAGAVNGDEGVGWPVGLHDLALPSGETPEGFRPWLARLGLEASMLGGLGEQVVWVYRRLAPWLAQP